MVGDLAVDAEGFGHGVGVVGQRHEFGDAVVDGGGSGVGKSVEEGLGDGEGGAEHYRMDVLRCVSLQGMSKGSGAYLALQHAKTALKDIHDGEIDAFPVVDDFVVVDTSDHECGWVVLASLLYALLLGFLGVPPAVFGGILLALSNESQELDVSRREEIPASINVDDGLAGPDSLALDQLVELALLFLDGVLGVGGFLAHCARALVVHRVARRCSPELGRLRSMPVPHITAGRKACRVGGIVLDALQHLLACLQALQLSARALITRQPLLERLYEVRSRAQEHAAHQIGGRDARGALDYLEPAGRLDIAVAVLSVAVGGDVVAVHDVLAAVVGDPGQRGDIGGFGDGASRPAAGFDGHDTVSWSAHGASRGPLWCAPLVQAHHRGALVLEDGFVRVHADEQLVAQLAGLQHGAGMACGVCERVRRPRRAGIPWCAKSKQPSTQMRLSETSTSACGGAGHCPSAGIHSPCVLVRCFCVSGVPVAGSGLLALALCLRCMVAMTWAARGVQRGVCIGRYSGQREILGSE